MGLFPFSAWSLVNTSKGVRLCMQYSTLDAHRVPSGGHLSNSELDDLAKLDERISSLRPANFPKLPSDTGEPYRSAWWNGTPADDASLGGPGPADALELYRLAEGMPIVTGVEPKPLGLSTLHSCPQVSREPLPTVSLARNGSFMEVHARQTGVNRGRRGGRRGAVRIFSAGARRRCLKLMASIDRKALKCLPIFSTLTYHLTWPDDPKEWKRHLVAFCKRIERRYDDVSIVWKLEPQERGAPHFHLLIFGVRFIPKEWVSKIWNEIADPGNDTHLRVATRMESVLSWEGVMSYASKYIGKIQESFSEEYGAVGRWWGVRYAERLPIKFETASLSWEEYYRVRRVLRGYVERKRAQYQRVKGSRGVRRPGRGAASLRGAPRPGRGYWSGLSAFIGFDAGLRLFIWAIGG